MANVNAIDGIKYGFQLLGYAIAVFLVGFVVGGIGGLLVQTDSTVVTFIGALIAFAGFLIFYAGFAGILYKIIADGVEKGVNAANGS